MTSPSPSTLSNSNGNKTLSALNLIAYIANIGLVNGVPKLFNLPDNAELSAKYQTIVTPAGFAFAIWGLIFLMQLIWSIVQFVLPAIRTNPLVVKGVGYNYIWVCAFQVAWTFSFALEQISLSLFCMLGILLFLIRIYSTQQKVLEEYANVESSFTKNYWLLRFPFGLHLGWITAATLVNANVVLVAHNDVFTARPQFYAAMLSLAFTLVVTAGTLFQQAEKEKPDVVIPLVLTWALVSIASLCFVALSAVCFTIVFDS
jgi:benzodiazapine receptor